MTDLKGRVALATGAARGQGLAHAKALAARGAEVVLCDLGKPVETIPYPQSTEDDLNAAVDLIRSTGGKATGAVVDIRDSRAVNDLVASTVAEHGRLDHLIANAGVINYTVAELSDDAWNAVIDTNPNERSTASGRAWPR